MEPSDFLLVGIEVSVAFAGFAGIIATFQFSDRTKIKRGDVVGLTMIVQNSLLAAFASALPLVLYTFDLSDETIWSLVSGVGAVLFGLFMYIIDRNMRSVVRKRSLKLLFGSMQGVAGLMVIALILNAANVVFHREPGPYIIAIVQSLGIVGYMFTRLLLRPLWHAVRIQESASIPAAAGS
jgi:hypothetical protein